MDRAASHDAPAVRDVLRAHEVLQLHGPARYPQYYGQHERQNREHNDWLAHAEKIDDAELAEMMRVLNERWLRPSPGRPSPAEGVDSPPRPPPTPMHPPHSVRH